MTTPPPPAWYLTLVQTTVKKALKTPRQLLCTAVRFHPVGILIHHHEAEHKYPQVPHSIHCFTTSAWTWEELRTWLPDKGSVFLQSDQSFWFYHAGLLLEDFSLKVCVSLLQIFSLLCREQGRLFCSREPVEGKRGKRLIQPLILA